MNTICGILADMKNKKLIVGNWKMNPASLAESAKTIKGVLKGVSVLKNTTVIVCPPYVFLGAVKKELKGKKSILLGAQDVYMELEGSFTGEISPLMLKSIGATHVIVGHSEVRRRGDTDRVVNAKVKAVLKVGLTPIICVGEEHRDESGAYMQIIKDQLTSALKDIPKASLKNIVIAYEPVWAIGRNAPRAATTGEALEISIYIKRFLSDLIGKSAEAVPILYGASVDPRNAEMFLRESGVSGLLVGRDSLDPKKFVEIIKIAERV